MAVPTAVTPNGTALSSQGSGTPLWSSNTLADDIGILLVETNNQAASLSDPQGFVELGHFEFGSAGAAGSCRLTAYWARAAGAVPTPPTVADSGDHQHARIIVFRGCITTETPVSILASSVTSASSTSVTIPGGTASTANELILFCLGHAIDVTGAHTSGESNADFPTSLIVRGDGGTALGNGGGIAAFAGDKAAAGAFAATTCTLDVSSGQVAITLELRSNALPVSSGTAAAVILSEGY